jgi:hypothetical protein
MNRHAFITLLGGAATWLLVPGTSRVMCSPAIPVGAGGLGHREIFFGGGNLTNSSPGRNRSGCSLGTPKCGLDTT